MTRVARIAIAMLAIVAMAVAGVEATGNGHLFAAVRDTYLRGRLTPPIGESGSLLTEHVRAIAAGEPWPWPLAPNYNRRPLDAGTEQQMAGYRTGAFLVIENGAIRDEHYWNGFDRDTRSNSNSVAKSLVTTLAGIALAEGRLRSLDQPVGAFLPEFAAGDRAKLTIRHLLTMSSATDFSESYDDPFAFPARAHYGDDLPGLLAKRLQVVGEPGRVFKYDSSNTALLGLVLAKAVGKPLAAYATEKLWRPLGAELPALWSIDREDGVERAYCCIYATARDFARLGQLFLDGGVANGRRLVPADYVAAATAPAPLVDARGEPTTRYGYGWWRMTHRGHAVFYAWGYQGQYVAVIPDRRLVVVRLGDGGGYDQDHDRKDLPVYLDAALEAPGERGVAP